MKHPYVKWKYLNPADKANPEKRYSFEITRKIALPFYTRGSKLRKVTVFPVGATLSGVPVLAEVISETQNGVGKGVLLREPDGFYIIPRRNVKAIEVEEDTIWVAGERQTIGDEAKEIVDDAVSAAKSIDTKKLTGFTPKQLLVIAGVGLFTYLILKD